VQNARQEICFDALGIFLAGSFQLPLSQFFAANLD
jgi:hypothetical protein